MTEDQPTEALPEHEVRTALLDLLAREGTVTATSAAQQLGYSSGLCSFHLRQLARHGRIEEAPSTKGRARPWRLRQTQAHAQTQTADPLDELARGLEDESYQRWLASSNDGQGGEAFSSVVYLTPEELGEVAHQVRELLAGFAHREAGPTARPASAQPVGVIARLFPLLG